MQLALGLLSQGPSVLNHCAVAPPEGRGPPFDLGASLPRDMTLTEEVWSSVQTLGTILHMIRATVF
jgi:hypothetical protein